MNKFFYNLATDPILWKVLSLRPNPDNLSSLKLLLRRCTLLQILTLERDSYSTDAAADDKIYKDEISALVKAYFTSSLNSVQQLFLVNCPELDPSDAGLLRANKTRSITQSSHFDVGKFGSDSNQTRTFGSKEVNFNSVYETDYYRRGRPYQILSSPGTSFISFKLDVSLQRLSDVTIALNHCRTSADGVVVLTVNGKDALKNDAGTFEEWVIMAPKWNFGLETFSISPRLLEEGKRNEIRVTLKYDSPGVYWLSDAKIEFKFDFKGVS